MIGKKGGVYHWFVVISIIVFLAIPFTIMSKAMVDVQDSFTRVTPNITSEVGNTTQIVQNYDLSESIFYNTLLVLAILLIFWAVVQTQRQEALR